MKPLDKIRHRLSLDEDGGFDEVVIFDMMGSITVEVMDEVASDFFVTVGPVRLWVARNEAGWRVYELESDQELPGYEQKAKP